MKPKVICHIMGSVDGRVLVERWSKPYGDTPMTDLLKTYSEIGNQLGTDAWTFGKNTITEIFPDKFKSSHGCSSQSDTSIFKGLRLSHRMFISIDPEADIKYTSNCLRGDNIIAVVGKYASDEYLAFLRDMDISYAVVENISNLADILEMLNAEFGITYISLQGGGVLNGGMLAQGMIDELSYVMYPGIDGTGDSVSIFNYIGSSEGSPMAGQSIKLLSVEQKNGGIVWLRYKIQKNRFKFHHNIETV